MTELTRNDDLLTDFALENHLGATPALRTAKHAELNLNIPFEFDVLAEVASRNVAVGVFVHIFYPELCSLLRTNIEKIPVTYDLFISTNTDEKKRDIERSFSGCSARRVLVRVLPNRGRDIAPFLIGFAEDIPKYDVVLHLHSKKSPHDSELSLWRDHLMQNLLGTPEIIASNILAILDTDIGILFPDHFRPVRQSLNFGYDYVLLRELLRRVGVEISKEMVLEFPSGSMFWSRPKALEPLVNIRLDFSDFPDERGQIDGTLAHAIERSLLYFAEHAGYGWCRVSTAANARSLKIHSRDDLSLAVRRLSRRLLGNSYAVVGINSSIQEISGVGARPDPVAKPRLTLLLPTLSPQKVFGGISTALSVFNAIAAELGDEFDFRIVSLNDPVSLECMRVVPTFQLVHPDAQGEGVRRSVVDGSWRSYNQLQVRESEIFIATAWWTAIDAYRLIDLQTQIFGKRLPLVYLIQDHEPDFYGWSTHYGIAQSTYTNSDDVIALVNSEELSHYMAQRYKFKTAFCIPFTMNDRLARALKPAPKTKTMLVYGRPQVARNAFGMLIDGLAKWQQGDPAEARNWRIISAGEEYSADLVKTIANVEVLGKLSLEDYASKLAEASVGISLMLSPHPSYPPLEMAEAGLITITNQFDGKDLSRRSDNIRSLLYFSPDGLAATLNEAVAEATRTRIGRSFERQPIRRLKHPFQEYSASAVAREIRDRLGL